MDRSGSRIQIGATLAASAALAGCGEPLSNRLFEEDEQFAKAVPERQDVRTEHPAAEDGGDAPAGESAARDVGDEAVLPPLARDVSIAVNGFVFQVLLSVDWLRDQDVTSRGENSRIWGPYEYEAADVPASLRLRVERSAGETGGGEPAGGADSESARDPRGTFAYAVQVAEGLPEEIGADASWASVVEGEFTRDGERELRDGCGSFVYDGEVLYPFLEADLGGVATVEHCRHGRVLVLRVGFENWPLPDGFSFDSTYFYERGPLGGGVFEYRYEADVVPQDGDGVLETVVTRARWLPSRAGRGDFTVRGGTVGPVGIPGGECWDGELLRTWWSVDPAGEAFDEEEGSEEDCPLEREGPREIE
jgi:hypothetical protein